MAENLDKNKCDGKGRGEEIRTRTEDLERLRQDAETRQEEVET